MSATVTLSVDRKLLLDLLITAIDWSCAQGYWGQIEQYRWEWWYVPDDRGSDEANPDLTDDTVLCRIRNDEDGQGRYRKWHPVTLAALEEATVWALVQYNHLFSRYEVSAGTIDDLDYDAIGADVILQRIVLGGVVYG